MADMLKVVAYFLVGLLCFVVLGARAVANGDRIMDSPVSIFSVLFWPFVVPFVIAYCLAQYYGTAARQRRRVREAEQREVERIIARENL